MSSYKNNVHFEGNLGKDAEKKSTPNGDVVNFSIAVNEQWETASRERIPANSNEETTMQTIFVNKDGQSISEQRRLIRSIEHLKRVLRKPGITLERLEFNGYRASPPRTIQTTHTRYIVLEDGAHLTFPRNEEFESREDFILWGRLAYRIGIAGDR